MIPPPQKKINFFLGGGGRGAPEYAGKVMFSVSHTPYLVGNKFFRHGNFMGIEETYANEIEGLMPIIMQFNTSQMELLTKEKLLDLYYFNCIRISKILFQFFFMLQLFHTLFCFGWLY